ncbi:DUF6507 family protein [Streptomyces johnsoniae]|uniref:DUF6507 family protein n=1 Tax=Streptomyces johnsoniae TaxID=3075532 RepID=A0ABU2S6F4_9ACTN|nr:DUF6507 family protein [Streptomyces sp. DSM 41886]MDT0443429.1 DUF6507 family protein [Streptomyces sp. DSM 41886]
MPDWDIEPQGVDRVLGRVGETIGGLERWGRLYQLHLQGAGTYAGTLWTREGARPSGGLVEAALAEFAAGTQEDVLYVAARTGASVNGAHTAAMHYLQGDVDMANDTLRAALAEPVIDPDPDPDAGGGSNVR